MKTFLNGVEMKYAEGGYKYVFLKPYQHFQENTINKENGDKMHVQFYDNGVQVRTLVTKEEVATIINREIAIDTLNKKIYILEEYNEAQINSDGSVDIIK